MVGLEIHVKSMIKTTTENSDTHVQQNSFKLVDLFGSL